MISTLDRFARDFQKASRKTKMMVWFSLVCLPLLIGYLYIVSPKMDTYFRLKKQLHQLSVSVEKNNQGLLVAKAELAKDVSNKKETARATESQLTEIEAEVNQLALPTEQIENALIKMMPDLFSTGSELSLVSANIQKDMDAAAQQESHVTSADSNKNKYKRMGYLLTYQGNFHAFLSQMRKIETKYPSLHWGNMELKAKDDQGKKVTQYSVIIYMVGKAS